MSKAKSGDLVRVDYKGTLDDGTVFDSSEGREPLEFKIGEGMVIPGFESLVEGLSVGESGSKKIPAKEAYGEKNAEMIFPVPRNQIPKEIQPEVGKSLMMQQENGQEVPVLIVEVKEDEVILDANHPLAGFDLSFELTLVEIVT